MGIHRGNLIYEGKAKRLYKLLEVEGLPAPGLEPLRQKEDLVLMEFKDDLTAFNAQKKGSFPGKGEVNRNIASLIFQYLSRLGVASHWIRDLGDREMIARQVEIIPLEVVVRNVMAGSTAKKLGLKEGQALREPLVEFYYKVDALNDPFVSDEQIKMLGIANEAELIQLKLQALKVNALLKELMEKAGILLVDFKMEFGRSAQSEALLLADEITPDSCRLWDSKTGRILDKDRFRKDLGEIKEAYWEVWERLSRSFQAAD